MKIAMLNLSNNITDFSTVSSSETIQIAMVLRKSGFDVDVISKTNSDNTISFEKVKDINEYDVLMVVNGSINFFGGQPNPIILNNFKLMAKFNKRIYYLLTDLGMPFRQLEHDKLVEWGTSNEEVKINSPILIVSQSQNIDMIKHMHRNEPQVDKIVYFPLERYFLFNELFLRSGIITTRTCDLIYGGSFRAGRREKKMKKFLFDMEDLKVEFFGSAKEDQFEKDYQVAPIFTGKVDNKDVVQKFSEGLATIIIGDPKYEGSMITLRVWETFMSESVAFIDNDFDPEHNLMINDFFYVNEKDDLIRKIKLLKQNPTIATDLKQFQFARVYNLFNKQEYIEMIRKLIYENQN